MKNYLYHLKPKDMVGCVLQPLNKLKEANPEIYTLKVKKYTGREFLLERYIPVLDCLWNDVIHLSPVEPIEWKEALVKAGMKDQTFTFYKIDPAQLNQSDLAIYLFKELKRHRHIVPDEEFVRYSPAQLETIRHISPATQHYFAEQYQKNEKPLLFFGIPHVLYCGKIDVLHLKTVTV
jgi:hypothetical protein